MKVDCKRRGEYGIKRTCVLVSNNIQLQGCCCGTHTKKKTELVYDENANSVTENPNESIPNDIESFSQNEWIQKYTTRNMTLERIIHAYTQWLLKHTVHMLE